jgi:hypothetical protein
MDRRLRDLAVRPRKGNDSGARICYDRIPLMGSSIMAVNITDSKFVYSGKSYFRGSCEDINLVSFGEKKTPIGKAPYLYVAGTVSPQNLGKVKVAVSGPYSIEWEKFSDSDVNVGIKYLTVAGGQVGFNRNAAKSANLVLMKLSLVSNALETLLNRHATVARNNLKDEGADARIVSDVWIVMEAQLASKVTTGGSVSVSAPLGTTGFTLEVGGSTSSTNSTKVQIPEKTCFAYLLAKVKKWDKVNGEWMVEELDDDSKGMT